MTSAMRCERAGRHIRLEATHSGTVRFLSGLHVDLGQGKTTSWVTLTRTGTFRDPRYGEFEIARGMLLQMVENFDRKVFGQDVFIDVAHKPADGAAGKIVKLAVEGDRLRAQVEWTDFGLSAIKERGFRYMSAEYHENWQDNETGTKHGPVLLGAGLVIRPCIKRLDPIQLSEAADTPPTLLHPSLTSELTSEITTMWKTLIAALAAALGAFKLAEPVTKTLTDAFEKSLAGITDEAQAKLLYASFEQSGKALAEQVGDKPVTLEIKLPTLPAAGLSEDAVKKLLAETLEAHASAAKKQTETREARVKLLTETIGKAEGLEPELKRELTEAVADLVTPEATEEQVLKLAAVQVAAGQKLAAAKKLTSMGFAWPAGRVHIAVDSSNEVKALQEAMDVRLGFKDLPDVRRYRATGGVLQAENKRLAEEALALYDATHGHQLHEEHKRLASGDTKVSDVAVPSAFERTVIREALYNLVGLSFCDTGTAPFSSTFDVPYSYRDTGAAGISDVRKYEGGSVARAAVKQALHTMYPVPQKLAFEVSDELRYLTSNGQLVNWDVVAESARNAIRIVGEDTERLIFDQILSDSDRYASTAVTTEAVGTGNGSKSIWPVASFPVLKPKKVYDLQGSQVGSTLYGITVTVIAVAISEYDFTGTQSAGMYYYMDYNLGELHFVNQAGTATAVPNTHAIVCSYTYTTNVYKFDTDLGSLTTKEKWNDFIYRFGLRKSLIEDQRAYMATMGLMSGTVMTQIEQAEVFAANYKKPGTDLTAEGNLGTIKGVPNSKAFAPGLIMGDARVIIGERGLTRFRMAKPWSMSELENQKDSNGRFTGKKEAYGDQFLFLDTPTPLRAGLTSIVLYSSSDRVSR